MLKGRTGPKEIECLKGDTAERTGVREDMVHLASAGYVGRGRRGEKGGGWPGGWVDRRAGRPGGAARGGMQG